MIPCSKSIATRGMYVFLFFLGAVVEYIINAFSKDIFTWIPVVGDDICSDGDVSERWCQGALSAGRVCFAFVVFHLLMTLFLIRVQNTKDFRASIQDGWWIPKILAIVALVVVGYVIPNSFFVVFAWICMFGAGFFILIQLMLLIEFAYTWAESWKNNWDPEGEDNRLWYWLLLGSSLVMYFLFIAATVCIPVFFYKGDECWLNVFFPLLNFIVCIMLTFVSVMPKVQEAHPNGTGLLQSAVVTLYASYLLFSAVSSEPSSDCNPMDQVGSSLSTLLLGAGFTILTVSFTTIRTATKGDNLFSNTKDIEYGGVSEDNKLLLTNETPGLDSEDGSNDDEKESVAYNYSFFHFTFLVATMFVYMLVIDWQTIESKDGSYQVDHGWVAVW
eukprot:CAMPEP_0174252758 /NCGR_PEP_ID=MMETSP0439-20130205/2130_1 /TAXON_ID=0 /ORGANISM="Stereomyxa ramosa, Strain Chinc5" /LENGTH=386 /DNA_ID=CAMNT_0015333371 /DNA_START=112 /DNA_END=1269 /DNA_ORIENTATION=-